MVFNPGDDGSPVLALVLIPPAGPGRLAVHVPLKRHVRVAHESLPQVLPAVIGVLQVRLHGGLVRLMVEELVEGVLGRVLLFGADPVVSYGQQ